MNDLRSKLMRIFDDYYFSSLPSDQFADEVITLFKKAGWKSPAEVKRSMIEKP